MAEYKYVDWPGLQYYHEKVTELIDGRLRECIKFGGEVAFAQLESPDTPDLNKIYRISDEFSVYPGHDWYDPALWNNTYPAGTILQVVNTPHGVVYDIFVLPVNVNNNLVDLENYYTIEEVDEQIVKALKPYATVEFVTTKLAALQTLISTVTETVNSHSAVIEILAPKVEMISAQVQELQNTKADITQVTNITEEVTVLQTNIENNYITKEEAVTVEQVTEVVTAEVNTVVTKEIETRVDTVIQEKIETGDIVVAADAITYGTF